MSSDPLRKECEELLAELNADYPDDWDMPDGKSNAAFEQDVALLKAFALRMKQEGGLEAAEEVPTTWLSSLLTGPAAVIGKGPYNEKDIERLLRAVKVKVLARARAEEVSR